MSKKLSAKHYQENKEGRQRKACERYQNLSQKEKEKKQECYKNLSEDEKQKLTEYREQYYMMRKNVLLQLF